MFSQRGPRLAICTSDVSVQGGSFKTSSNCFFFLMWQHIPASGPWMFPVTPLQCCFLNAQKQKKITVDLIHPMLIFATRTL